MEYATGIWLTLRNQSDLGAMRKEVHRAFGNWRRAKEISPRIRGGIWASGLTFNARRGGWHYHLHLVVDARYIPREILHRTWSKATRGQGLARIETVRDARGFSRDLANGTRGDLDKLMAEAWHNGPMRSELWSTARGWRWFGAWGSCRDLIRRPEKDPERQGVACPHCGAAFKWSAWEHETIKTSALAREIGRDGHWADYYLGWNARAPLWRQVFYRTWADPPALARVIRSGRAREKAPPDLA